MSEEQSVERIKRQREEMERIRADAKQRIERMRRKTYQARTQLVRKRDTAIRTIQDKIDNNLLPKRRGRYKEIQRNVDAIAKLVLTKHELVRRVINPESLQRNAASRVDRGLEVLERVIQGLRQGALDETFLDKMNFDPFISRAIEAEAKKITETNFFKSLQKQLEEQREK